MMINKNTITGVALRGVVSRCWKLMVFLWFPFFASGQLYIEVDLTSPEKTDRLYFNQGPDSENSIEKHGDEFSKITILTSPVDTTTKAVALYVSDAEIQSLRAGGRMFYTGKYQNNNLLKQRWNYRYFIIPREIWNGGRLEVELKNVSTCNYSIDPIAHPAELLDSYLNQNIKQSKLGLILTIFFLGAISIFLLYMIGLSIQNKNRDFRFYAIYLAAILVHNGVQADAFLKIFALSNQPIFYHIVNEFFQMYIYIAFIYFLDVFLELKASYPSLHRFVTRCNYMFVVFSFLFLGVSLLTRNFLFVQNYLSILWVIVSAVSILILWKVYHQVSEKTKYYIIAGSLFLMTGSFLELFSSLGQVGAYNWNLYAIPPSGFFPFNFTQIAILIEAICFALGIGYKIRKREQLLTSLQEDKIQYLRVESEGKDSKIESLVHSIAEEKTISREAKEMAELMDLQFGIIRYQLNPHFLFNNLNAINNFIIHDEIREASKYLVQFSRLLRQTVSMSQKKMAYLNEEVKFIKNYLELELKRLGPKFLYDVTLEEGVVPSVHESPPQLIQAYLEFCLWNHVMPVTDSKPRLSIQYLIVEENKLMIKVVDNGIHTPENRKEKRDIILQDISKRLELLYPDTKNSPSVEYAFNKGSSLAILLPSMTVV